MVKTPWPVCLLFSALLLALLVVMMVVNSSPPLPLVRKGRSAVRFLWGHNEECDIVLFNTMEGSSSAK